MISLVVVVTVASMLTLLPEGHCISVGKEVNNNMKHWEEVIVTLTPTHIITEVAYLC